jgi:GDP-L-fucose synthase
MRGQRIYIAGHRGLVGSALMRSFGSAGYEKAITRTREELDLTDQQAVRRFIGNEKPNIIVLAAAKVGGINANKTYRWQFLHDNLAIEANVIGAALESGVERLVFLGSSCVYPKLAPQPMREDALLTGPLEPTNEPYAIAKIAGLKLVEAAINQYGRSWVSLMPTNLYGPGDNFHLTDSHVIPGMIRKFHEAKVAAASGAHAEVTLWGHGTALREFMHVDDLASAVFHVLKQDATGLLNVGTGDELSIRELAATIASVVGYTGPVSWDSHYADGTPRKLLDSTRMRALGWKPRIGLREGLESTYQSYLSRSEGVRA